MTSKVNEKGGKDYLRKCLKWGPSLPLVQSLFANPVTSLLLVLLSALPRSTMLLWHLTWRGLVCTWISRPFRQVGWSLGLHQFDRQLDWGTLKNLNALMPQHGVDKVNLKGFMADSVQANWNDVASYTEVEMHMRRWWTDRGLAFSIGCSPWSNIPRPISVKTSNLSIKDYASNTWMKNWWRRPRQSIWQFGHGGYHQV